MILIVRIVLFLSIIEHGQSFTARGKLLKLNFYKPLPSILLKASSSNVSSGTENDGNESRSKLINKRIISQIMMNCRSNIDSNELLTNSPEDVPLEMTFVGKGYIPMGASTSSETSACLFLSPSPSIFSNDSKGKKNEQRLCMPIPLPSSSSKSLIKLISFAYKSEPISKSLCLTLSPLLVNRDGSLYDNLPWDTWTIESVNYKRNVDAAGNNVDKKYHLGKRDAYNRFMGKDWYGRSISIGNLAARAKYLLENDYKENSEERKGNDDEEEIAFDENATKILARRVLELEIKESKMAVAEAQEQLAIVQTEISDSTDGMNDFGSLSDEILASNYDRLQSAIQAVQDAKKSLDLHEIALEGLLKFESKIIDKIGTDEGNQIKGYELQFDLISIFSKIIESQQSDAPYRGAIGFKPTIDSKEEMFEKSALPYSSPYDIMNEIINEQLNAEVIGCFIENTSLFNSSIVLGGALVLKRKSARKELVIDGEDVVINDSDEEFGNKGIKGGEVIVIECDCDEAVGMSIACGLCISIPSDIWSSSQLRCIVSNSKGGSIGGDEKRSVVDAVPMVQIVQNESIEMRTQGSGMTSKGIPIQIPRDNNDRSIGSIFLTQDDSSVFNTDIPVRSLKDYDAMTVSDKAQLLLSLESFKGRLPRPRVLKEAALNSNESQSTDGSLYTSLSPLDEILIPLIDESVRRQIMIREAKRKGDMNELDELNKNMSLRQRAKEKAEEARNNGNEILADLWEDEAKFYASLRADVTQDVGTYSSFLDRDEWYERNRLKNIERNRKRYGSLFDNSD